MMHKSLEKNFDGAIIWLWVYFATNGRDDDDDDELLMELNHIFDSSSYKIYSVSKNNSLLYGFKFSKRSTIKTVRQVG